MQKFSIILPVRNGGEYVKECVASVLSQTLGHFTLHILDNCSTDGTTEWLHAIKDDRVFIYPAEKPLTIEENWLRITKIQKNEFITMIGHDDVLDKSYLVEMERLINKHPNASLYRTHFIYINAKGASIRKCKPMSEKQRAPEFLAYFLCNMIDSMGTGFMMRAKDYDTLGGIPMYPNLLFADFELWINLTMQSYMATSFEECFFFRLHQSTTTTSSDSKFQLSFKRFVYFLKTLKDNPELDYVIRRYGIDFMTFYTKSLAHRLLRTPASKRGDTTVKSLVQECKVLTNELVPGNEFDPEKIFSIKLAKQIDSNPLSRALFLSFKKAYTNPIYSA